MASMEMNESEAWDFLDLATTQRYGVEAVEFMCLFEEGVAESKFPGCEDLLELAEWLGDQ